MKTFRDLEQVFKLTLKWEQEILDLYDIASYGVKNEQSKELVVFLKQNHQKHFEVLKNLNLKDYGHISWMQFTDDKSIESEIPVRSIDKNSPPLEIFENVVKYEEKLKNFYLGRAKSLVSESQKALFESLFHFKVNQVDRIRNFIKKNFAE
ncbi:MAG: hypothetical protein PF693_06485 [Spirochaetia bacterium]|nr:hypothetical protein [Spirochaetia bacterium]